MTVTILCLIALAVGIVLCGVLAEPWQRNRYERWADTAEAKLASLEAQIASEMNREARDG